MKTKYIILIIAIVVISGIFATQFNVTDVLDVQKSKEKLTDENTGDDIVCDARIDCISYLKSEGMPDNFLEDNNIDISCDGGVCYAE